MHSYEELKKGFSFGGGNEVNDILTGYQSFYPDFLKKFYKKEKINPNNRQEIIDFLIKNTPDKSKVPEQLLEKVKLKKENFKQYVIKFLSFPEDELQEATDYFLSKPIKTFQNRFHEEIGDPTYVFLQHKKGKNQIVPITKPKKEKKIVVPKKKHGLEDVPNDLHKIIDKINTHIKDMEGSGLFDKPIGLATNAVNALKNVHSNVISLKDQFNKTLESKKKGNGLVKNYFKPKGMRQLIYFSDSSSDEDEPHLPMKR